MISSPTAKTAFDSRTVQNVEGFFFMFIINTVMRIFNTSIPTYLIQFSIVHREIHNGLYSLSAYYVAELILMVRRTWTMFIDEPSRKYVYFSDFVDYGKNVIIQHHCVHYCWFWTGWFGVVNILHSSVYRTGIWYSTMRIEFKNLFVIRIHFYRCQLLQ